MAVGGRRDSSESLGRNNEGKRGLKGTISKHDAKVSRTVSLPLSDSVLILGEKAKQVISDTV